MSILQSKSVKVIMLSVGQGLNVLAMIFVASYLSRVMSQSEYGTYRQTFLVYEFASPLLILGMPQALFVFVGRKPDLAKQYTLVNMGMLFASGLLFGLLILTLGKNLISELWDNPALSASLGIMSLYGCFFYPTQTISGCLMGIGKAHLVLTYNVSTRILIMASVIGAVVIWGPYASTALMGVMLGTILSLLVAISLVVKFCPQSEEKFSWAMLREQVGFAVPVGLASLFGSISLSIDRLIVSCLTNAENYAIYANGAVELPIVGIITGSITAVIMPEMSAAFAAGDKSKALELWHQAAVKSALVLFPICALFMISADTFITLLYSEKYAASAIPFRYYLLLLPARIVVFGALFQAMNKPREVLYFSIVGLLGNSLAVYSSFYLCGFQNAALGSVLSMYILLLPFLLHRTKKLLSREYTQLLPWIELLNILLINIIAYIFSVCWEFGSNLQEKVIKIVIFMLIIVVGYTAIPKIRKQFGNFIKILKF
jgi:O-antigen/teichoic acid export membrane protein